MQLERANEVLQKRFEAEEEPKQTSSKRKKDAGKQSRSTKRAKLSQEDSELGVVQGTLTGDVEILEGLGEGKQMLIVLESTRS